MLCDDLVPSDHTLLSQAAVVQIILLFSMFEEALQVFATNRLFFLEELLAYYARQAGLMSKSMHFLRNVILDLLVTILLTDLHLKRFDWGNVPLRINLIQVLLLDDLTPVARHAFSHRRRSERFVLEDLLRLLCLQVA